jgi:hypothetical protein
MRTETDATVSRQIAERERERECTDATAFWPILVSDMGLIFK